MTHTNQQQLVSNEQVNTQPNSTVGHTCSYKNVHRMAVWAGAYTCTIHTATVFFSRIQHSISHRFIPASIQVRQALPSSISTDSSACGSHRCFRRAELVIGKAICQKKPPKIPPPRMASMWHRQAPAGSDPPDFRSRPQAAVPPAYFCSCTHKYRKTVFEYWEALHSQKTGVGSLAQTLDKGQSSLRFARLSSNITYFTYINKDKKFELVQNYVTCPITS